MIKGNNGSWGNSKRRLEDKGSLGRLPEEKMPKIELFGISRGHVQVWFGLCICVLWGQDDS